MHTQQWHISYNFADGLRAGSGCSIQILLTSCRQTCVKYTIAECTIKTPDNGQRNCPKHVEFPSEINLRN